jgi:hypothetical protein
MRNLGEIITTPLVLIGLAVSLFGTSAPVVAQVKGGTVLNNAEPISSATPKKTDEPQKKWICDADGLGEFRYSGDEWAYIRLNAFSRGHDYPVKKEVNGEVARGVTQNGTPFVCTKK